MHKSTPITLASILLDAFFPRFCLACNLLLPPEKPSAYLCSVCARAIPVPSTTRCAFCTNPAIGGNTCRWCITSHALDVLLVAADYSKNLTVRIVKALKYRFARHVAFDMGELMASHLKSRLKRLKLTKDSTIIVPIPLHSKRLRWRGFNQADLLASHIATKLSLPYQSDVLQRLKSTAPQADIEDRQSRIANMKDMFAIADHSLDLKDKIIVLVDDVSTTGSTLDNAARVLKSAGAKCVIGFVFARG